MLKADMNEALRCAVAVPLTLGGLAIESAGELLGGKTSLIARIGTATLELGDRAWGMVETQPGDSAHRTYEAIVHMGDDS